MFGKNESKITHTRKISPMLGVFGVLGLLGFLGFLPYEMGVPTKIPIPIFFLFFAFFGFFGFYYEGKMSNTLIDERFIENSNRAEAIANKTGMMIIFLVAIIFMSILKISSTYALLSILIATIGFSEGLAIFLSQYLLYKFENEE